MSKVPDIKDVERVEEFIREPLVLADHAPAAVLARGTVRRRAFEEALIELDAGADEPSADWCRKYSLVFGLERILADPEPKLVDGTTLNAHQVDVLQGTLAALVHEGETLDATTLEDDAGGEEPFDDEDEIVLEDEPEQDADDEDEDGIDWEALGEEDPLAANGEAEPVPYDPYDKPEPVVLAKAEELDADPNADRRFWFEHATGSGKSVAALGFIEASRTGGVLILTHRRNLVDQFIGELVDRGYKDRISSPLLQGQGRSNGPVTVETYQWFVRHAGNISDLYSLVICDEAHTALGEKTSAAIRRWKEPIFLGMTATGALIARHVTDLFPTQTSRFDLSQAARRGVIAPLRCVRIPPGVGVRSISKVPLRRGEVDQDFDQEELAVLLDQGPFNAAVADLYRARFKDMPGVVYSAGVKHAYNVAEAFVAAGISAKAVSGETPKKELQKTLADYEAGKIDVLVNAQLLIEGWNSPRATICMHLAPTASKRIYQQRVGRVTRRHPGKEAGIVVDFVHPSTSHDDPVVTLHSLLGRDVYRGGAIVVGPVRRGRGRRMRVERRVLPVTPDPEARAEIFERELWRIGVVNLDWGEQHVWAALAGAKVNPNNWRRARAMIQHDRTGELRRRLFLTALERNKHRAVRLRALQDLAASRDPEAYDHAIEMIGSWQRDERREATKLMLKALADKDIGSREQSTAWIWALASYTRDQHEQYAVQRWPETKRLLGLLVNSSGSAHGRNARRLVHETRKHDLRLASAILAAAVAHSPEAEEALRGGRTRLARKPGMLARELGKNFPKPRSRKGRKRKPGDKAGAGKGGNARSGQGKPRQRNKPREKVSDQEKPTDAVLEATDDKPEAAGDEAGGEAKRPARRKPRQPRVNKNGDDANAGSGAEKSDTSDATNGNGDKTAEENPNRSRRTTRQRRVPQPEQSEAEKNGSGADEKKTVVLGSFEDIMRDASVTPKSSE